MRVLIAIEATLKGLRTDFEGVGFKREWTRQPSWLPIPIGTIDRWIAIYSSARHRAADASPCAQWATFGCGLRPSISSRSGGGYLRTGSQRRTECSRALPIAREGACAVGLRDAVETDVDLAERIATCAQIQRVAICALTIGLVALEDASESGGRAFEFEQVLTSKIDETAGPERFTGNVPTQSGVALIDTAEIEFAIVEGLAVLAAAAGQTAGAEKRQAKHAFAIGIRARKEAALRFASGEGLEILADVVRKAAGADGLIARNDRTVGSLTPKAAELILTTQPSLEIEASELVQATNAQKRQAIHASAIRPDTRKCAVLRFATGEGFEILTNAVR